MSDWGANLEKLKCCCYAICDANAATGYSFGLLREKENVPKYLTLCQSFHSGFFCKKMLKHSSSSLGPFPIFVHGWSFLLAETKIWQCLQVYSGWNCRLHSRCCFITTWSPILGTFAFLSISHVGWRMSALACQPIWRLAYSRWQRGWRHSADTRIWDPE